MTRRLAGAIACAAMWLGCEAGGGGTAEVELRPGVVEVGTFATTGRYSQISIIDVERIGDRIIVLVLREEIVDANVFGDTIDGYPHYFVSDDRGGTWEERTVQQATEDDRYRHLHRPSGGLLVHQGQLYELVPTRIERALGDFLQMMIYRVDLEAGRRHFIGILDTERLYYDGVGLSNVQVIGGLEHVWTSWDPATGTQIERRSDTMRVTEDDCFGWWWDEGSGGAPPTRDLRLTCSGGVEENGTGRWCRGRQSPPADLFAEFLCFPQSEWPVRAEDIRLEVHGPLGMLLTTGEVDGPHQTSMVDFGAGGATLAPIGAGDVLARQARDAQSFALERDRFPGLVALVEPGEPTTTTLYRRGGEGFEATDLPTRPCATGRPCGYRPYTYAGAHQDSVLQWGEPLGDEVLLFYVVDTNLPSSGRSRNVIYASRERIGGTSEPVPITGPLVQACARATSCFETLTMHSCLDEMRHATAEAHDALLAATDCATVRAALPSYVFEECPDLRSACVGDVLTYSCGSTVLSEQDCAATASGASCEVIEGYASCTGGTPCTSDMTSCLPDGSADSCGTITDCPAMGALCGVDQYDYARCMTEQPACAAAGVLCLDEDTIVLCASAGLGEVTGDCTRIPGMICSAGACRPREIPCDDADRCDGTRLSLIHI